MKTKLVYTYTLLNIGDIPKLTGLFLVVQVAFSSLCKLGFLDQ